MSGAEPVRSYLRVKASPEQLQKVNDLLCAWGCLALDTRPGGEVCAYSDTEAELELWATQLDEQFGSGLEVAKRPLGEEWKVAWARALGPIAVTPSLRIEPWDSTCDMGTGTSDAGPMRLYLEPAFAFGFGEHPTTRMLIAWLEGVLRDKPHATVLDFGCGTGVLALAALCFGATRVEGIDVSEEAVVAARRNAELNGLSARCRFSCEPLAAIAGCFDVIVANVDAETLSQHAEGLATRMSVSGRLALSGLLDEQAELVRTALSRHGVATEPLLETDGWIVLGGRSSSE